MTSVNTIEVAVGDIIEIPELQTLAVVNQTTPTLGASELAMTAESGEATFWVPGTVTPPIRVIGKMSLRQVAEGTAAIYSPRGSAEYAPLVQKFLGMLERQEAQGPIRHQSV